MGLDHLRWRLQRQKATVINEVIIFKLVVTIWDFLHFFPSKSKLDLTKLIQDPKFELNDPDPYPTRHPKYAHSKVDPKSELTRTEPYPIRNFLQSCLFWHDECIWLKISWPEIDPNRTISDSKRSDLKCHLTRTWPDPNLIQPVPEPNDPFARFITTIKRTIVMNNRNVTTNKCDNKITKLRIMITIKIMKRIKMRWIISWKHYNINNMRINNIKGKNRNKVR